MKEIVAIIPARSGSKGVPHKNIKLICGFPLIAFSIAVAKKSKLIDRVIVSTDSEEYAEIAIKYGAEVPFIRPSSISGDDSKDTQFIDHTIRWFEDNESYVPKFFAHLRPTSPIRSHAVIDEALSSFINSQFTALRSCHKMSESSYKTFEIEEGKLKCLCDGSFDVEASNDGRHSYPATYNANGYIDVIRTEIVQNHGFIHGNRVQAFITEPTYEIDEISDVEFLEYLIMKKPDFIKSLFK